MLTEQSFWSMQFKDVLSLLVLAATIVAIFWGPIKAVEITRANDDRREKRRRQFEVFHSLMKTRRFRLAPGHVMALNLVQVEFYQHERIDAAYRNYMTLLARTAPPPSDPGAEHFYQQQEDALYDLLHEIGQELGYAYDRRDLQRLAYGPRGWEDDEMQQRVTRNLLIELLTGKRALPVIDFAKVVQAAGKYPPPPSLAGDKPNGADSGAAPGGGAPASPRRAA
jgi:hypothetical protein